LTKRETFAIEKKFAMQHHRRSRKLKLQVKEKTYSNCLSEFSQKWMKGIYYIF